MIHYELSLVENQHYSSRANLLCQTNFAKRPLDLINCAMIAICLLSSRRSITNILLPPHIKNDVAIQDQFNIDNVYQISLSHLSHRTLIILFSTNKNPEKMTPCKIFDYSLTNNSSVMSFCANIIPFTLHLKLCVCVHNTY